MFSITPRETIAQLEGVKKHLTPLSPDQINIIKAALPKTGLQTKIVDILEEMRMHLMTSLDRQLYEGYELLRKGFISHIDSRVVFFQTKKWTEDQDRYVKAMFHFQDILFTSGKLIEAKVNEHLKIETEELREFRKQSLPSYISLFQNLGLDASSKMLKKCFREMHKTLSKQDYEGAEVAYTHINTLLKANFQAIETLIDS